MDDALAAVLGSERAIVRRGVQAAREVPGGWALRHPPLPDVWHLNRVHLTEPVDRLDAADLIALADRWLDGVAHRRVTLDDVTAADALWPALQRRGWRRERAIVMLLGDDRRWSATVDPRVRMLDEATLAATQRLALADDATVTAISADLPARLAAAQSTLRARTEWRGFGAAPARGDPPASNATLYLDAAAGGARVAIVDQVATLRDVRGQGLATAVVHAAIRAARDWHADTIGLFADADDWPQVMYAGMGFAPVGHQVVVHRDGAAR